MLRPTDGLTNVLPAWSLPTPYRYLAVIDSRTLGRRQEPPEQVAHKKGRVAFLLSADTHEAAFPSYTRTITTFSDNYTGYWVRNPRVKWTFCDKYAEKVVGDPVGLEPASFAKN